MSQPIDIASHAAGEVTDQATRVVLSFDKAQEYDPGGVIARQKFAFPAVAKLYMLHSGTGSNFATALEIERFRVEKGLVGVFSWKDGSCQLSIKMTKGSNASPSDVPQTHENSESPHFSPLFAISAPASPPTTASNSPAIDSQIESKPSVFAASSPDVYDSKILPAQVPSSNGDITSLNRTCKMLVIVAQAQLVEIDELKLEIRDLKLEVRDLKLKVGDLELEVGDLKPKVRGLKLEVLDHKARIDELEKEKRGLILTLGEAMGDTVRLRKGFTGQVGLFDQLAHIARELERQCPENSPKLIGLF